MRRYLVFFSAALGLLMYSIDSTVVAVAFPNFIKDFGTNVLWAAWTISIYLIAVTTVMPLGGIFRTVGGALGVSLITIILHSSPDPSNGFRITFISFGLGLLFAIPLVFLMPAGKRGV